MKPASEYTFPPINIGSYFRDKTRLLDLDLDRSIAVSDWFDERYGNPVKYAAALNEALTTDNSLRKWQAPYARAGGLAVAACHSQEQLEAGGMPPDSDQEIRDGIYTGTMWCSYLVSNSLT